MRCKTARHDGRETTHNPWHNEGVQAEVGVLVSLFRTEILASADVTTFPMTHHDATIPIHDHRKATGHSLLSSLLR